MADLLVTTGAPAPDHGVYGISVAAELSGIAVQSLRLYERYGLLDTGSKRRRNPALQRRRLGPDTRISELVDAGINLAGIARILDLEDDNATLSAANTDLRSTNRTLRTAAKTSTGKPTREPPRVDRGEKPWGYPDYVVDPGESERRATTLKRSPPRHIENAGTARAADDLGAGFDRCRGRVSTAP